MHIHYNFYILYTIYTYENLYPNRDDTIASASEDGSVLFWDVRTKEHSSKIVPSNNPAIKRLNLGNWIGSVTITKDWMVEF